jgi:type IV pilus assembly protein PilM
MAVKTGAVWAVDIGNNSLKALHLSTERGSLEVIGFDNIQHGKILSGAGVKPTEKAELVAISLRNFVSKHDLSNDEIIVSVPSQNSFARFVKLPPVEKNRIPEIVKFEAVQQIPFDINDVQWDWQMMTEAGSSEQKVGIFAIKNEVVDSVLEHFNRENLRVDYVQMAPMALYNYLLYDRPDLAKSNDQATVVLNIGADNTDLVVCTKSTVWQRCILIGGNNFTKAIAETFKLNFEKAEKLKRTAPVSKYARQIFQAMRPVFTDLVSEVQRSLGFYSSSNPNTKIVKIIALGGGAKLRGLLKYFQQTLQIPVEMPDSFKRVAMGSGVSPAKFHENVCDFGIVYGLALQGVGLGRIESNLLPRSVARSMAWTSKSKYFIAAASLLLLVSLLCFARTSLDKLSYSENDRVRQETSRIIDEATKAKNKLKEQEQNSTVYEQMIKKEFELFNYRNLIPLLHETILSALPNERNNAAQKELYEAFAKGEVQAVLDIERKKRKQIFITGMSVYFTKDIESADFDEADLSKRSRYSAGITREEYAYEDYRTRGATGGRDRATSLTAGRTGYAKGQQGTSSESKKPGFVVTITGYSPYENIGELMEPRGIEDDRSRWGFITRLLHLDGLAVDGNSPFELYKKTDIKHFKLEIHEVSYDSEMPIGIGIVDAKYKHMTGTKSNEQILIDPMTKEVISKVVVLGPDRKPKLDERTGKEIYKVNDRWFVLNAKFIWKDAPESAMEPTESTSYNTYGR